METDEDIKHTAGEQQSEHRSYSWNTEETQFMLELYKKNMHNVGPGKVFRSKLHLWNEITLRLNKSFNFQRTTIQCITRFKAVQKKKRKNGNSKNLNEISSTPHSDEEAQQEAEQQDNDNGPLLIAEVIRSTLLEIHERKEEARERRHRERMQVLQQFLVTRNSSIDDHATAVEENKLSVRSATQVTEVKPHSENSTEAMRARLLEMQRKKMEDRERKQRVAIEPKQRLSVRDFGFQ